MLVFFMLATNFNKDKQISFSSNMAQETLKRKLRVNTNYKNKKDNYEMFDKKISIDEIRKIFCTMEFFKV